MIREPIGVRRAMLWRRLRRLVRFFAGRWVRLYAIGVVAALVLLSPLLVRYPGAAINLWIFPVAFVVLPLFVVFEFALYSLFRRCLIFKDRLLICEGGEERNVYKPEHIRSLAVRMRTWLVLRAIDRRGRPITRVFGLAGDVDTAALRDAIDRVATSARATPPKA